MLNGCIHSVLLSEAIPIYLTSWRTNTSMSTSRCGYQEQLGIEPQPYDQWTTCFTSWATVSNASFVTLQRAHSKASRERNSGHWKSITHRSMTTTEKLQWSGTHAWAVLWCRAANTCQWLNWQNCKLLRWRINRFLIIFSHATMPNIHWFQLEWKWVANYCDN